MHVRPLPLIATVALAVLVAPSAAQEGGDTHIVVDVENVTGSVTLTQARAAVSAREQEFTHCGLPQGEAASIAVTVAPSGRVRVVPGPDLETLEAPLRRYRRCIERAARALSFAPRTGPSAFTIVVRLRFTV